MVGDALGVPVEFRSRLVLRQDPVTSMREFGSHMQPAGTWSDDSSMMLVTTESLLTGFAPTEIMAGFRRWVFEGLWTPRGTVFDIGATTREAIFRFDAGRPPTEWGGATERSNGNGGLMRLLPVALHGRHLPPKELARRAAVTSALTHAHPRSRLCCALFALVVAAVLRGVELRGALAEAAAWVGPRVPDDEREILADLLSGAVFDRSEADVKSGGYVVHTLEAALWCCARAEGFQDAVLAAVNLGGDTDTTGAVAGGLAGVLFGRSAIPEAWVRALARGDEVEELATRFAAVVSTPL